MIQLPPARMGRQGVPLLGDMGKPTMRGIRLCTAMVKYITHISYQEVPKMWNLQRHERIELQEQAV